MRIHRLARPAVIAAAAVTLVAAACSNTSSTTTTSGDHDRRLPGHRPERCRLDLRAAALPAVVAVLPAEGARRADQLPGDRVRRRHRAVHVADRRLRRDRRAAAERRDLEPAEPELHRVPDRARRRRLRLQRAGRRQRPQARRQDDRRHLPRQHHQVERPGDREPELRREPPRRAHPDRAPVRRVRNHRGVDRLALGGEPRVVVQGRRGQGRAVAGRNRCVRQRRRRSGDLADRRRRGLPLVRLREDRRPWDRRHQGARRLVTSRRRSNRSARPAAA